MKNLKILAIAIISFTTFVSCNDDDNPVPVNEEEVITTVTTTLVTATNATIQTVILKSRDLDGDGPNAPVVTVSGTLKPNTVYTGTVSFLNEIANPVENITEEVLEEGVNHQVFFQAPSALGTFSYSDTDANGKPIGLQFTFTTTVAATGNLLVTLRHELNKSAAGVSGGSITNAGGNTDAAVTYAVVVQ